MKKIALFAALGALALCLTHAQSVTIDAAGARASYGSKITVTPQDKTVTVTKDKIVFAPKKEGVEYTISGYFNGQIVNKTKNTVLKLKGAYLENTAGEAAVYGEAKTEISTAKDTVNYIVSSGTNASKVAALHGKKNLELGGSGTLYVAGGVYHGVKGDDVKLKGSGTFYLQGSSKGSALNCRSLVVEKDKAFTAYLVNSKNGVKADNTISVASGTFCLYNLGTAFKTDTKSEAPTAPHGITLSGGTYRTAGVATLYDTENGAYRAKGAKFVEE